MDSEAKTFLLEPSLSVSKHPDCFLSSTVTFYLPSSVLLALDFCQGRPSILRLLLNLISNGLHLLNFKVFHFNLVVMPVNSEAKSEEKLSCNASNHFTSSIRGVSGRTHEQRAWSGVHVNRA